MAEKNITRIDKWLWAVRIYKTRTKATDACNGKRVKLDGKHVKPSKIIHIGNVIQVRKGIIKYEFKVIKIAEKRMGAKFLSEYIQDLTPKEELHKLQTATFLQPNIREKGRGRPTKKERRIIDKFRENL